MMAENPMTRAEIEDMFYWNRFPIADELMAYVHREYHAGPDAGFYTDQDAWEQTRKLAMYYAEHGRLPGRLEGWMPGWEIANKADTPADQDELT